MKITDFKFSKNKYFIKYYPYFEKYKEVISYIFFGGITTVVDFIVYMIVRTLLMTFTNLSEITYVGIATTIAWIIAVTVAFITNKLFVFESKKFDKSTIISEAIPFVSARVISLLLTLAITFICVKLLRINDVIVKIATTVFVLIFNYVASKLFVFKQNK